MAGLLGRNTKPDTAATQDGQAITNGLIARREAAAASVETTDAAAVNINDALLDADNVLTSSGFTRNDAQAVKFAISQNIRENGAGNVIDAMRARISVNRDYRKKVTESYSVLGAEVPSEVLERLDDLEKVTAQSSIFGMTGKFGAEFTSGFNIDKLLTDEEDLINEIQTIAGPALAREQLVKHHKSLADIGNVVAATRVNNANAVTKEQQTIREETFGALDSIYADATRDQLSNALRTKAWAQHGVSPRWFGEYVHERIKTQLAVEKVEAETARVRNTRLASSQKAAAKAVEDGKNAYIGDLTEKETQILIDIKNGAKAPTPEIQTQHEIIAKRHLGNIQRLGITLTDLNKSRGDRATEDKDAAARRKAIAEGAAAESIMDASLREVNKAYVFATGVPTTEFSDQFSFSKAEIAVNAELQGAPGTLAFDVANAQGVSELVTQSRGQIDDAIDSLVGERGTAKRTMFDSLQRTNGSVTVGNVNAMSPVMVNYAVENYQTMGSIPANRGLSRTGSRFSDSLKAFNSGRDFAISLSESFSIKDEQTFKEFLTSNSKSKDKNGAYITVQEDMRQQYEGDVKRSSIRLGLQNIELIAPHHARNEELMGLLGNYIDSDTGDFKASYISSDGHPNIKRMVLEAHLRETGLITQIENRRFFADADIRGNALDALQETGRGIEDSDAEIRFVNRRKDFIEISSGRKNDARAVKDQRDLDITQAARIIGPTTKALSELLTEVTYTSHPAIRNQLFEEFEPRLPEEILAQSIINPVRQKGIAAKFVPEHDDSIVGPPEGEKPVIGLVATSRLVDIDNIRGRTARSDVTDALSHLSIVIDEMGSSDYGALLRRYKDTGSD